MRDVSRFFAETLIVGDNTLSEAESRHALQVLRMNAGDPVELFDGCGRLGLGVLKTTGGKKARAAVVAVSAVREIPQAARRLTLIVAGCKGARLDWLVEKCTELGVCALVFATFERSVVHVGESHLEKLRRAAIEACKQCGRLWLPELAAGATPAAAVAEHQRQNAGGGVVVCHPDSNAAALGDWLRQRGSERLAAVIGPEGGLTDGELQVLRAAGATAVRLAEDTLRVETAAIAAAACFAARGS